MPSASRTAAAGTRPTGVSVDDAAEHVRRMFDGIAPTYDLGNHVLSLTLDRMWRWRAARRLRRRLDSGAGRVRILDVCCGTGDLSRAVAQAIGPAAEVVGADFSHGMLVRAQAKFRQEPRIAWLEADAMRLPCPDGAFAAITTGFGFRNLVDYRAALREFHRALAPGGYLAILECSLPRSALLASVYRIYFEHVLPRVGAWLSGSREAYRYLPESVGRFPVPELLAAWIRQEGFGQVEFER